MTLKRYRLTSQIEKVTTTRETTEIQLDDSKITEFVRIHNFDSFVEI